MGAMGAACGAESRSSGWAVSRLQPRGGEGAGQSECLDGLPETAFVLARERGQHQPGPFGQVVDSALAALTGRVAAQVRRRLGQDPLPRAREYANPRCPDSLPRI